MLSSTTSRQSYSTNGVTVSFPISFYFRQTSDIKAKLQDTTTKAITAYTDFTITGTVDPDFGYYTGGSLVSNSPVAAGSTLVLYRDPSTLQETEIIDGGPLPAKPLEAQLDLSAMVGQRVEDLTTRSVRLNDGDASSFSPILPDDIGLAGSSAKVLTAKADGTGFEALADSPSADDITNASANATAAAASAAAAAASETAAAASATAAQAAAGTNIWGGNAGGTADALTLTPAIAPTSYVAGLTIQFNATATNTGAATVNVSSLGIKNLKRQDGSALQAGDIISGDPYRLVYQGTYFVVSDLNVIADNSVDTSAIQNGAVTSSKIDATLTALIAKAYFSGYHDTDSSWARTNTSLGDFTADASSTFATRVSSNLGTVTSALSGSDKLPGVAFTPTYTGVYKVSVQGTAYMGATGTFTLQLVDGSGTALAVSSPCDATINVAQRFHLSCVVSGTAAVAKTVKLYGSSSSSTINLANGNGLEWIIERIG